MNIKPSLIAVTIVLGLSGCAATTSNTIKDVRLDMSTGDVLATVGEPAVRAEQGPFQAWRYEFRVLGPRPCNQRMSPAGGATPCRQVCEHATVWFNSDRVRSMTRLLVDDIEGCGTGTAPITWESMPDYVQGPGARIRHHSDTARNTATLGH